MSAKRFPKAVVKAAAKQVKGWDGKDSEPHQVVPESNGDFSADELALMEDALHSAIRRHEESRRWALVGGDRQRAKQHEAYKRDIEALLEKVRHKRRPRATAK